MHVKLSVHQQSGLDFSTLSSRDCLPFTGQINQAGAAFWGFRPFPRASEMSFVYRRRDCEVTSEWKKQLYLSGLLICVSSVSLPISLCSHTFKISAIYFLEICTVYIKVHVYIKQSTFQYHFELFFWGFVLFFSVLKLKQVCQQMMSEIFQITLRKKNMSSLPPHIFIFPFLWGRNTLPSAPPEP